VQKKGNPLTANSPEAPAGGALHARPGHGTFTRGGECGQLAPRLKGGPPPRRTVVETCHPRAILDTLDINPETFRRRFRGKEYQQSTRPRALAQELKDACCRWLQPDQHSKAELIDQIVMEQFLHVIPSRGRTWVMSIGGYRFIL
uniref:SCAN box domain-containing protein n=1 Tax=Pelusios castaneus TaxID=367368 RepID=A0A8C8SAS4_9SAUR